LIGWRIVGENELKPKGDGSDIFYIFNGTNRLKRKYITYVSEYVFEYECEFEINNGEIVSVKRTTSTASKKSEINLR